MGKTGREQRVHKRFRILFIDLETFWTRFILHRKVEQMATRPVPPQVPTPPPAHPPRPSNAWNLQIATGIPEIDQQHGKLLETIQKVQHALKTDQGAQVASEAVSFLMRYVEEHFRLEEAYKKRLDYPGLAAHHSEHLHLRRRVLDLKQRVALKESGVALELSILLFQWLKSHIMEEDQAYVEFARKRTTSRVKPREATPIALPDSLAPHKL